MVSKRKRVVKQQLEEDDASKSLNQKEGQSGSGESNENIMLNEMENLRQRILRSDDQKTFIERLDTQTLHPIALLVDPSLLMKVHLTSENSNEAKLKELTMQIHLRFMLASQVYRDPMDKTNYKPLLTLLEALAMVLVSEQSKTEEATTFLQSGIHVTSFALFMDDVLTNQYKEKYPVTLYKIYKYFELSKPPGLSEIIPKEAKKAYKAKKARRLQVLHEYRELHPDKETSQLLLNNTLKSSVSSNPAEPGKSSQVSSIPASPALVASLQRRQTAVSSPLLRPSIKSPAIEPRKLNHFNQGLANLPSILRSQTVTVKRKKFHQSNRKQKGN